MDIETIDPGDDEAVVRAAAQLAVPEAALRQALAALGNDLDKVKGWLAAHPAAGRAPPAPAPAADSDTSAGGCRCGRVRFLTRGQPLRVGICHCTDCRHESGSAFTFYGIWPAARFEHDGATSEFRGRHTCAHCGSRLFALDGHEAEIKLGALAQAPTRFVPTYELWVKRREPWLQAVPGADQFAEDRR